MSIDLQKFSGTLPYAAELFGIYQPLLGWRSKRTEIALLSQTQQLVSGAVRSILKEAPKRDSFRDDPRPVNPDDLVPKKVPKWLRTEGGLDFRGRVARFVERNGRAPKSEELEQLVTETDFAGIIKNVAIGSSVRAAQIKEAVPQVKPAIRNAREEAVVAGVVSYLAKSAPETLFSLLQLKQPISLGYLLARRSDPLADYDPAVRQAVLSPIGLIQLFREYFFEFDSFLGPPIGHVWISPGSSLELFEIHTRRTTEERQIEFATETTTRSETEVVDEDEISTAISEQNSRNTSIGVSASVSGSLFGIVQARASASFGMQFNTQTAQEESHRHSRTQSEKLSDEIRRNFKTTFRTVVETTDTSSRRYVVQNSTDKLINYELRRKMRQVGVQVQHLGTQLCWQFYVDSPGMMVGLAELVHAAQPADVEPNASPPEAPARLDPKTSPYAFSFQFDPIDAGARDDGGDEEYHDGFDIGPTNPGHIGWEQTVEPPPPDYGYTLKAAEVISFERVDPDKDLPNPVSWGVPIPVGPIPVGPNNQTELPINCFRLSLHEVNFNDQPSIHFTMNLTWEPPEIDPDVKKDYDDRKKAYNLANQKAAHAGYVKAVRERIKLASNIKPRPSVDLREEERITIYRRLLDELTGIENGPEPHLMSELIRAIFDVDKMLYFVAEDWWLPKTFFHFGGQAHQQLGGKITLTSDDIIGWGGTGGQKIFHPNYKITEDSEPARMGSSIGWLLQLDGDPHRNAFLNSPWVKAVLPIRPGREDAAINWLKLAHVEGTKDLGAQYGGNEPELSGKTVEEAIHILAHAIQQQGTDIKSVLATETVYQAGFNPLDTGFQATGTAFEVFDQWIEILPTDQVVAVDYPPPVAPV